MDEDSTWYGSRSPRRPHCIRRVPSAPRKGHSTPPPLGPCLLWPRSPISATAELLFFGVAGFPSHTMSPKPRPTSLSSGILIHRTVWPQQTGAKNWGLCAPFLVWRKLGPHLSQCGRPRPNSIPSFILIHPSNRLTTIHQRHRQTGEDLTGQTTADSIWRTVLQTVAEKRNP